MKLDWRCDVRFAALALALVLSAVQLSPATAQTGKAFTLASAPSSNTFTTLLEFQEVTYPVVTWGISVQPQATPFAKEPSAVTGKAKRGRLDIRPHRGTAMGFIWDFGQAKLYLDVNGNGDLTDDTNGVFTCALNPPEERHQEFREVRLTNQTDQGSFPMLLDLSVHQYNTLYVSASLRSFYSGKLRLSNRDWEVGIIEKPYADPGALQGASFLFRSWESRTQAFRAEDGKLHAFSLPKMFFYDGHSYQIAAHWETPTAARGCRLEFAEQPAPLGDLKVAGEYIRRAVLKDANRTVVLDAPAGTVRVPVGSYPTLQVHLQKGESSASLKDDSLHRGVTRTISVQADKPGMLVAGGPLTNAVALSRRGNLLVMQHSVTGAGGDAYELDEGVNYQHPPTFAVFSGEKQLATGKFEFG